MPALNSPQFYSELFRFDVENAMSFKKHLCDDEVCKKYFYEAEMQFGEEEHKQNLTPGKSRSRKQPSIAEMIASRLEGTEKNRIIRLQQNGIRISPGPIAPQSVVQNHQNHMIQSHKIQIREKRQENIAEE